MFITEISSFPSFSPFKKYSKSLPTKFDLLSRSFDDSLLLRIKALSPPSLTLSWLSQAVDFLRFVHVQANALISNLKLASFDESLSCYLENCLKVLDLCNSATSQIERLRHRRLLVNFLLQQLTSDPAKAKDSLSKWESSGFSSSVKVKRRGFEGNVEDLVRDLARGLDEAPRGKKMSAVGRLVRRTIHAVGLITVFVAGATVSMLYGSTELIGVRAAPAEFSWADSFNDLESTVLAELKQRLGKSEDKVTFVEMEEVESRIREVRCVMDDENKEMLNAAVKELEKKVGSFSDGLDRLGDGINGIFHAVLCTRNGMLENMRFGQQDKKQPPK